MRDSGFSSAFLVREYTPGDREIIRQLCCDTGFLGEPIDPVFEDRELFADYLTSYYTDLEPESCRVLENAGKVVGYLLGCRHPERQKKYEIKRIGFLVWRGLTRYLRYKPESRRYVHWILSRAWKEVPPAPQNIPHFHINLVPSAKRLESSRELVVSFLDYLRSKGEKAVYGQMVVFDGKRGEAMFRRYGFEVLNRSEVSKYRGVFAGKVYLCTVKKELGEMVGKQSL